MQRACALLLLMAALAACGRTSQYTSSSSGDTAAAPQVASSAGRSSPPFGGNTDAGDCSGCVSATLQSWVQVHRTALNAALAEVADATSRIAASAQLAEDTGNFDGLDGCSELDTAASQTTAIAQDIPDSSVRDDALQMTDDYSAAAAACLDVDGPGSASVQELHDDLSDGYLHQRAALAVLRANGL